MNLLSSKLQNALQKLDILYQSKKALIPEEQVKLVEHEQELEKEPLQQKNEQQKSQVSQQQQIQQQQNQLGGAPNYPVLAKDKKTIRDEKSERKRKILCLRKSAGFVWEDQSLADWPENDYRLFCGNLGNEVSDEVLANAFRKYKSFFRARVIRDKRTMKTKGYGFVSFLNPADYLKAFNEMNGRYVGNRPVKITRSEWKDRSYQNKKKDGLDEQFIKPKIRKVKKAQM